MAKELQQCFSFWCQMETSLLNFANAKRLCLFCLMTQKHCWNNFAFNQSYLAKGKNTFSISFASWGKIKIHMILHSWTRTGSDWWFSKILRIRTGSESILSDQDWTWTENFHRRSALVCARLCQCFGQGGWYFGCDKPCTCSHIRLKRVLLLHSC